MSMTDDDKALVERLRASIVNKAPNYIDDAADRIEAISAENDRLREALLQLKRMPNYTRKEDIRKEMLKITSAALGETK